MPKQFKQMRISNYITEVISTSFTDLVRTHETLELKDKLILQSDQHQQSIDALKLKRNILKQQKSYFQILIITQTSSRAAVWWKQCETGAVVSLTGRNSVRAPLQSPIDEDKSGKGSCGAGKVGAEGRSWVVSRLTWNLSNSTMTAFLIQALRKYNRNQHKLISSQTSSTGLLETRRVSVCVCLCVWGCTFSKLRICPSPFIAPVSVSLF